MKYYGSDKPDIRFDMKFVELKEAVSGHDFVVFDSVPYVGGICATITDLWKPMKLRLSTNFLRFR
jgi:aspartyl-tRNA synthetase